MRLLNIFGWGQNRKTSAYSAMSGGQSFDDLNDSRIGGYMRGSESASGASVTPKTAMKNTTVLRCVGLISTTVGMLPLHLHDKSTKEVAKDHPLNAILHRKPNGWQTAVEFRTYMQQQALTNGNAFARIVRSGGRIIGLIPLSSERVQVKQDEYLDLKYTASLESGETAEFTQDEIFHIRNLLTDDGVNGLSLVKQAAESIGLALQAEKAAARMFKHGLLAGANYAIEKSLTPEARARLKADLEAREGADNAHRPMLFEDGLTPVNTPNTGKDVQNFEQRGLQIEEIARAFGVPRPLLGVNDTTWGSGVDVLGQMFVRYGLNPWFSAWEQAVERSLLTDAEADRYEVKFNAGALIRGSLKDQAEYLAKALGAGGHSPFMHPDEARELLDMPERDDLPKPMGQATGDNK